MCAVPSALSGLASGFGMGTGRFPDAFTTAKFLGCCIQFKIIVINQLFTRVSPCGWLLWTRTNSECLLVFVVLLALAPHQECVGVG